MASSLLFAFLLLFYQLSDSVIYSGVLTALTVVLSRLVMFFLIPIGKPYSPVRVASVVSFGTSGISFLVALASLKWGHSIFFYFLCSILFSLLQEIRQSFSSSIIPHIVDPSYLFKANSLNGIFFNVSQILAPLLSYFFTTNTVIVAFLLYGVISGLSGMLLVTLTRLCGEIHFPKTSESQQGNKLRFFSTQWMQTLRMLGTNRVILSCLAMGILINVLFAGINGPFLLKEGHGGLGSTLIKVSLSVGSLLGVYGAFVLKVKDYYQRYLRISLIGAAVSLAIPVAIPNRYLLLACVVMLTLFVMFIMNTTGTLLQVVTPLQELPAVYEIRSTFYSIVVPLSYIVIGWVLERWSYTYYFAVSAILLMTVGWMIGRNQIGKPRVQEVEPVSPQA